MTVVWDVVLCSFLEIDLRYLVLTASLIRAMSKTPANSRSRCYRQSVRPFSCRPSGTHAQILQPESLHLHSFSSVALSDERSGPSIVLSLVICSWCLQLLINTLVCREVGRSGVRQGTKVRLGTPCISAGKCCFQLVVPGSNHPHSLLIWEAVGNSGNTLT
jgi:hypothetical protein